MKLKMIFVENLSIYDIILAFVIDNLDINIDIFSSNKTFLELKKLNLAFTMSNQPFQLINFYDYNTSLSHGGQYQRNEMD